jgi:hypothetical protein
LVEGHGELGAVDNLLHRLSLDLGLSRPWAPAIRWQNLHLDRGLERGANLVRYKRDAQGLLILRDEDDACPAQRAPLMANRLCALRLALRFLEHGAAGEAYPLQAIGDAEPQR